MCRQIASIAGSARVGVVVVPSLALEVAMVGGVPVRFRSSPYLVKKVCLSLWGTSGAEARDTFSAPSSHAQ